MGEVLQFPDSDFKHCSYVDIHGDLGICSKDRSVVVTRLNDEDFEISTPDGTHVYKRAALAEFLWLAAVFIDSQEKFRPDGKGIGCDY